MTLNIKYEIIGGEDDQKGQIYNNLNDLFHLFYFHPNYSLDTLTIHFSFYNGTTRKRHYFYLLKSVLHSEQDIRTIVYALEEFCNMRSINFQNIDQFFVKASLVKLDRDERSD